ncbi:MAG TPA: peptidoglycan-associated lipoprotein Pal [Geobacteraceae bacterium]
MRKVLYGCVMVLAGGLMLGGCAKDEMVKKDEPMVSTPAPAPQPTPPPPSQAPIKAEVVQSQPIKEAPTTAQASQEDILAKAPESSLERIYFDFDSFALSQQARDTLYANAEQLLKKTTGAKVRVEGHCDERGSDEYNLALGEKRAKAALNYLVTLGVPTERLAFVSFGKEKPLDPGHDEAAWGKNRRAEFVIVK